MVHSKWFPLMIGGAVVLASCGGSSGRSSPTGNASPSVYVSNNIPDTPVGAQLRWLLGAVALLPLTQKVIDSHFDSLFLSEISVDQLNSALLQNPAPGGALVVGVLAETPTSIVAATTFGTENLKVTISVDDAGLIDGLFLTPIVPPPPTSWGEVDRALASLAPNVGFLAAQVSSNGTCAPIHQLDSSTPRPLGSEFKLFVLGALAQAIASGGISWNQELTVQDALRSIGNTPDSGSLQYSPTGSLISVQDTATKMISISDNTAADMLINLVGRSSVEAQLHRWSTNSPSDVPFLTTRELFILHYVDYPSLANQYLRLKSSERAAFLATAVDPLPLGAVQGSTEPRDVESIEWFASPEAICHAFAGLQGLSDQQGLAPLSSILSANSGDLGLAPSRWPVVWFKGGSEPGVLTLGYLAKDSGGRTFVVSAMLSNPNAALSTGATGDLLSIIKGAFGLVG